MARHRKNGVSFSDAVSTLEKWYHEQVKEWADEFDKRIAEGEFSDREEFIDRFDEETDSAGIIIYTQQAKAVMFVSRNEDAYEDEMGDPPPTVEAGALMAFRRDILERMSSDVDDDDTFEQEEEDEDD